jgi:hypothetical protein
MIPLQGGVNMIQLQILPGATGYALLALKERLSPGHVPVALVLTLPFKILIWHAT